MTRLGPVDHFLLMVDRAARRAGLPGNLSAIALELEGVPAAGRVEAAFAALVPRLPRLRARLALVPILGWSRWKDVPARGPAHLVRVLDRRDPDAPAAAAAAINDPLDPGRVPLVELRLAPAPRGGSFAVLRWFHPLADARGADLLLAALDEEGRGRRPALDGPEPFARVERGEFSGWRGFRAARALLEGKGEPPPVLLAPKGTSVRGYGLVPFALDERETRAQEAVSRGAFGGTGENEHLLLASFRALHRFQVRRGAPRGPYRIPLTANLRAPGAVGPVLGNHLAFFHLRATAPEVEDSAALARSIRGQGLRALEAGEDRAMHALLRAGRWLPLRRYERERFLPNGAPRESIWFSNAGEIQAGRDRWFGCSIRDVGVATAVPHPPGVLLLFFRRAGTLRGAVVCADEVLDREAAFRLAEFLREELLAAVPPRE
ncbi:MAG TPA: hypothetical protein VFI25_15445 [Planctomycetota bacterium]|jgi:hypothetical protein|nr:hypothetical protein [Planctomycetota bacterium]